MVKYKRGFDRSRKMSDTCKELINLARLQLSEALRKTREENREITFGIYATKERAKFTDWVVGDSSTIQEKEIQRVYSDLVELSTGMESGEMCIVHTHPTGNVRPSPQDARYILTSLGDDPEYKSEKLRDLPAFDCFYILGQMGKTGKLRGYNLDRPVDQQEFRKIMNKMGDIFASSDTSSAGKKRKVAENAIRAAGDRVHSCEARFNPFKKEYNS